MCDCVKSDSATGHVVENTSVLLFRLVLPELVNWQILGGTFSRETICLSLSPYCSKKTKRESPRSIGV